MKKIIFTIYYLLFTAHSVFASSHITTGPTQDLFELPNPLGTTSITGLLKDIIDALTIFIAPPIAVLMIIIGAFQMLSAGGDPEKFKTGKKTILYAAIGFAILLLARLIIGLVQEILGVRQPSPLPPGSEFIGPGGLRQVPPGFEDF